MNMNKLIKWLKDFLNRIYLHRESQKHFKEWEKRIKSVDQLSPKDRNIYYEEEQEKWKSWHGE
jgi:hypothetical protein